MRRRCTTLAPLVLALLAQPACHYDLSVPGLRSLVDETFEDFIAGTLSDAGAGMYVSAKGNVQLIQRLDVNQDGFFDLVLSQAYVGPTSPVPTTSLIYLGSAAGFASDRRRELPVTGAAANAIADLDDDGHPDVVFAGGIGAGGLQDWQPGRSQIYYGGPDGPGERSAALPTPGATDVAVADLNQDGFLDLVFAQNFDNPESWIYWGSGEGYSEQRRASLPSHTASGVTVADLNHDGYLDVVLSNREGTVPGDRSTGASFVHLGGAAGFSAKERWKVRTTGAMGNTVADLDGDGHLDVLFCSNGIRINDPAPDESVIFWGSDGPLHAGNVSRLEAYGAQYGCSVADLDGDGHLDIVVDCSGTDALGTRIFWGNGSRDEWSSAALGGDDKNGRLTTVGSLVADFNRDGARDLAVTLSGENEVALFFGDAAAPSGLPRRGAFEKPAPALRLPATGGWTSTSTDPGTVADRGETWTFTSRPLDTGSAGAQFKVLSWSAKVPAHTKLGLLLRAAPSEAELQGAPWLGPGSDAKYYERSPAAINPAHDGQRWVQYQASLTSDGGASPVLDRVELTFWTPP